MITEPLYEMKKHQWITGLERFENAIEPPAVDFSRHYQSESGQFWFIVPESWLKGKFTRIHYRYELELE